MTLEQRKHRRFFCETVTQIRNMDAKDIPAYHDAVVSDISEGGMRISSPRFIPIHHRLVVKIEIPQKKPIETVAKPVWIREVPSLGHFEIGARFLTLSEEDKIIIQEYTRVFMNQARPASSSQERA